MAKLMEVIEKSPNFKKGTVSMKLLDTTFSQLTRKIGSQAGVNYKTVRAGQMLSKELLQSLNRDQLTLKEKLLKWQQAYNTYIDSIKSIITDATHFDYTFTSLVDYTSKYVPNKTLADYYLLTEFVNAEKELYEFGHYWGSNHIKNLAFKMKEWSKNKDYGSTVNELYCLYEIRNGNDYKWQLKTNTHNLEVKLENKGRSDFCYLTVSGVDKIPLGETATVVARCDWNYYSSGKMWAECVMEITRTRLGVATDDGKVVYKAFGRGNTVTVYEGDGNLSYVSAFDKIRESIRVISRTGVGSPHFDCTDNIASLNWIKSRVLI